MADKDSNPTTAGAAASATTAAMLNQPIVIDCGSSSMKAGFAGGTKPKVCCAMHCRWSKLACSLGSWAANHVVVSSLAFIIHPSISHAVAAIIRNYYYQIIQGVHRNQGRARQAPTRHARWRTRRGRAEAIGHCEQWQISQSFPSRWRCHLILCGTNIGRSSGCISVGLSHGTWTCGGWWMGGNGAALGGEKREFSALFGSKATLTLTLLPII